jgi:hypothetical protein
MTNEMTESTGQSIVDLLERVLIHLDRDGAEKKAIEDMQKKHAARLKVEREEDKARRDAEIARLAEEAKQLEEKTDDGRT